MFVNEISSFLGNAEKIYSFLHQKYINEAVIINSSPKQLYFFLLSELRIVENARRFLSEKKILYLINGFWEEKNNKSDFYPFDDIVWVKLHKNNVIWVWLMNYSQKRRNIAIFHLIFCKKMPFLDINYSYLQKIENSVSISSEFLYPTWISPKRLFTMILYNIYGNRTDFDAPKIIYNLNLFFSEYFIFPIISSTYFWNTICQLLR